jgi:precorrin isomerase
MYLPRALPYIILTNVTMIKNGITYKLPEALFDQSEEFYDAEQYINVIKENAQKAKQQMELRALNKILKSVVDENFKW